MKERAIAQQQLFRNVVDQENSKYEWLQSRKVCCCLERELRDYVGVLGVGSLSEAHGIMADK